MYLFLQLVKECNSLKILFYFRLVHLFTDKVHKQESFIEG